MNSFGRVGRNVDRKRFHFMDRKKVFKSKKEEGLGIRPLKIMNEALLGKWLWQLGDE